MKKFFKRLFWACVALAFIVCLLATVLLVYLEAGLPNVKTLKDVQLQQPLRIYTADDQLIAEYGAKRRIPVTLDQIPKMMIDASLATEDERFYSHGGIDIWGLGRAALVLVTTGRKAQGGSTITMQVARNYFLTRKKTYIRKLREILLSMRINHELSKDKVLELYFNKIFYGNRAYGLQAAAFTYYGKPLKQLTVPQMAMLAGLPKAPSTLNPLYNPQAALDRRNHVLTRMRDQGYISKADYQQYVKAPLTASYHGPRVEVKAPYVAAMVQKAMAEKYGQDAYEKGLDVYTTINSADQLAANQAVFTGEMQYDRRHGYRGVLKSFGTKVPDDLTAWQDALQKIKTVNRLQPAVVIGLADQSATIMLANGKLETIPWAGLSWARKQYMKNGQEYLAPKPNAASDILALGDVIFTYKTTHGWLAEVPAAEAVLIAMHPENGAIKALVGGFSYASSQFNRATQANRQPGSSFKPFIYSAALDKGFTLASMLNDAPVVLEDNDQLWRPENDTRKFYGMTSLKEALMQSRNLVSIRLLQLIGIPYAIDYATRFGFQRDQLPNSLSLALGTASVTPMQMLTGYAVFANGGYKVVPHLIDHVTMNDTQTIYQANLPQACEACLTDAQATPPDNVAPQVITPQNAYLMTLAMQDVIKHGTAQTALSLKRDDLAGKTGTTNDKRDAWFSGYNHDLVATAWMGFDSPRPLYEFGNQAALPIWIDFMGKALDGAPESVMPEPPGLVRVKINPKTGALAAPGEADAVFETFRQNDVPAQSSDSVAPSADSNQVKETLEQQVY
ncbi:MAG: peptidase [Gammaproteobacteria bacterium CG11_big_fil_rev_8_21_14_0_20_46_22]|nr:MAG: peptidase [Gammaproteobacteria bacterium CG12_big_fil_rev_8_21_14_0_65_46_12]PIR12070.1 MAG: peptidase [Gammaproteobacteria bacterium CG11_big_fil_rev_8_21_14_0_20_46_22]